LLLLLFLVVPVQKAAKEQYATVSLVSPEMATGNQSQKGTARKNTAKDAYASVLLKPQGK